MAGHAGVAAVLRELAFAITAALLLALAFPGSALAWCAPLGTAALFFAWKDASPKRAFAIGWLAGWIFFTINFWWWSTTLQTAFGSFAVIVVVVVSAGIEALAIGAAGGLAAFARSRCAPALVPLAAAAAFAITEWLRSIGPLGFPLGQLGYTQADTPLRVFAADIGTNGLTFVLCAIGAYAADAVARGTWRAIVPAYAAILGALGIATLTWPARHAPPPRIPVAAIQGNVAQSINGRPDALALSIQRYAAMSREASRGNPRLIVWPEGAIPHALNREPALLEQFRLLARAASATIVVGSVDVRGGANYNSLYFFMPSGKSEVYDKHQLVPFGEYFPDRRFLGWLPGFGELNGGFTAGTGPSVFSTAAGVMVAPLICWESAFGDLAYEQVREGGQLFVVSTDDAWFGTSSGPYQHAQIAQLRAIEAGAYVVRAAATGISGIIAPTGAWVAKAPLDVASVVPGLVGPSLGSPFSYIGPGRIAFAFAVIYLVLVWRPLRRRVVAVRLAAIIGCTVGQVAVDSRTLGLGGAILFVSCTLLFAMVGLKWSYLRPLLRGERVDAALYSCGGAVWGSLIGAVFSLAVLARLSAWPALSVPFALASLVYYAAGKLTCIELRCCEAIHVNDRPRLPVVEFVASIVTLTVAVWLLTVNAAPGAVLACTAVLFATLRIFSRLKRGHGLARCLKAVDVVGVYAVAVTGLLLVFHTNSGHVIGAVR